MGFLDRNLTDLTLQELGRIISRKIQTETPPLPKWLLSMDPNSPAPYVPPDPSTVNDGEALVFDSATQTFVPGSAGGSDGLPPTDTSPTPIVSGALGAIVVRWTAITNDDATGYDVHVVDSATRAGDSAWLVSSTTLYARVVGTLEYVKHLPDGSDEGAVLDYDTDYYIKIVAFDNDGPLISDLSAYQAAAGAESTPIRPSRVGQGDITALSVTADKLEGVLVLGNIIRTNPATHPVGGGDGQYVELSSAEGLRVVQSDGTTIVQLPTDEAVAANFKGAVTLTTTEIDGNMTIKGTTNVMDNSSGLQLRMALQAPPNAPVMTGSYPSQADMGSPTTSALPAKFVWTVFEAITDYKSDNGTVTVAGGATGPATDNIPVYYSCATFFNQVNAKYSTFVLEYNATTGAINRAAILASDTTNPNPTCGAVRIGSYVYAVYERASDTALRCAVMNVSDFDNAVANKTLDTGVNGEQGAIGTDGTSPYYFTADASSHRLNYATIALSGGAATTTNPVMSGFTEMGSGYFHFDSAGHADNPGTQGFPDRVVGVAYSGGVWHVGLRYNADDVNGDDISGIFIRQYTKATGLIVADSDIFTQDIGEPVGLSLGSAGFAAFSADSVGRLLDGAVQYDLSSMTWSTALGARLYMGYSLSDGTYATDLSPIAVLNRDQGITTAPAMRQLVLVTAQTLPTGADRFTYYGLPAGSSAPASTSLKRQTVSTYMSSQTAIPVTWVTYNASGTAYVAPPNDSGLAYLGGTPSYIKGADSTTGGGSITTAWKLAADGVFRLPQISVAQRLLTKDTGDLMYDTGSKAPTGYWGTDWGPGFAPLASRGAIMNRTWEYYDEFMQGDGATSFGADYTLAAGNGGVAPANLAGEVGHPGILLLDTGTTNNDTGSSQLRLGKVTSTTSGPIILGTAGVPTVIRCGCIVRFPTITTPFFDFRFGLMSSGAAADPGTNGGFIFRWNNNVNSGKFQRMIGATAADTGATAVVAGNWYLLEIVVANSGSAEFFINNTSVGTSSSATLQSDNMVLTAGIVKNNGSSSATSRKAHIDAWYVAGENTLNRYT